jgi:FemAB-related protein (PEP-CTERM system-associated)
VLAVPVLELRDFSASRADWPSKSSLYAIFRRQLNPSVERNLKAIPRKQRAMVRKGMSNGLRSEIDHGVDRLYRVYAESVHNLGTPVFAKSYFRILRDEFSASSDIVTVSYNGKAVASVLNFYFRDEVLPFYGGGLRTARVLAANDFMYWEVMRRASERGYRVFDFGRSKVGTGSYAFKCNWGFQPTPLVYQFRLAPGRSVPDLNPLNPKLAIFVAAWKRLPLTVATQLGPSIVRGLG